MNIKIGLSALAAIPLFGATVFAAGQVGVINYEYVNIRVNPGSNEGVKFVLKKGDEVEILSKKDAWINIKFGNKEGWVQESAVVEKADVEHNIKTSPANISKVVNNDILNFRKAPNTKSGIIQVLKKGEQVTVLEEGAGWTKAKYKGNIGYLSSRFLSSTSSYSSTGASAGSKMEVLANNLSIRKSANSMSEKIAVLNKGDLVEFMSSSNGWNKVRFNGHVGYVSSYYLKHTKEVENVDEEVENVDEELENVDKENKNLKNVSQGNTNYIDMGMSLDEHVDMQMAKTVNTLTVGGWRKVTRDELRTYMDPSNYMDPSTVMQFALIDRYTNDITASQLNAYFARYCRPGSIFYNQGQAFIDAARKNNINVLYLVAHSMIETGYGTSKLARGTVYKGKTVYNFFGIGAVDGNALAGGSATAYNNGWTSVAAGIDGAASWISSRYIHSSRYHQNTLYSMKWNQNYMYHQYATEVRWPSAIANKMADIASYSSNIGSISYNIPRYR